MMSAVLMLLIRHADAGSRREWAGDDRDRPLSALGVHQARALADALVEHKPALIATSPYLRCLQTVLPLADAAGRPVVPVEALGVQGAPEAGTTLQLLARRGTGPPVDPDLAEPVIAVCTHGEVIAAGLDALGATALAAGAAAPGPKAGTWLLRFDGDRLVDVGHLAPPA